MSCVRAVCRRHLQKLRPNMKQGSRRNKFSAMLMHHFHLILFTVYKKSKSLYAFKSESIPTALHSLSNKGSFPSAPLFISNFLSEKSSGVYTCLHIYYYFYINIIITIDSPYPMVASALCRPSSVFHTRWRAFHAVIWLPSSIGSHFPRAKA